MSGFSLFHWSTADCMPPSQLTKDSVTLPWVPPVLPPALPLPDGELEEPHAVSAAVAASRARDVAALERFVRNPLPPSSSIVMRRQPRPDRTPGWSAGRSTAAG